jgi:hypothetical protein
MIVHSLAQRARVRWCGLALGAVLLGLALPSGALADGCGTLCLTTVTVSKNDGFKLTLGASKGFSTNPSVLSASLEKHSGGTGLGSVTQSNDYGFAKGITFTGKTNLSSAHIAGTFAKKRGSIKMTFHATSPASSVPLPKGCTGKAGTSRKGKLSGSFQLKADRLGTVRLKSIRATLARPPRITGCSGGSTGHATYLSGYNVSRTHSFFVTATEPSGTSPASEDISVSKSGAGFNFSYELIVMVPRSDYTSPGNLKSATLTGYGPIHGSASYTGSPPSQGMSRGTLSGDLSVAMFAIGTVKPFANGPLAADQGRY